VNNLEGRKRMTTSNEIASPLEMLRTAVTGEISAPGDQGYDQARQAWNLAVDERPDVVVMAESAADIVQAVRFARSRGMRSTPCSTWLPRCRHPADQHRDPSPRRCARPPGR
jgi:hypothetical protein